MRAGFAIAIAVLVGFAILRASERGPLRYSGSGLTSPWTKRLFVGFCVVWGLISCCVPPVSAAGLTLGILIAVIGILAFLSPDRCVDHRPRGRADGVQ